MLQPSFRTMRRPILFPLFFLASAAVAEPAPPIRLAATEWPPYAAPGLPHQGISSHAAKLAAEKMGRGIMVDYFPWKRAVALGEKDSRYDGYFPAYYTADRATRCQFSRPLGYSRIGFAYLQSAGPFNWEQLPELESTSIGVVRGYSNGEAFDQLRQQGSLKQVVDADSDLVNLRKLVGGRIRLAVVDANVMQYLLNQDPVLQPAAANLRFHPKLINRLSIHVCFKPGAVYSQMRSDFNKALADHHASADDLQMIPPASHPSTVNETRH